MHPKNEEFTVLAPKFLNELQEKRWQAGQALRNTIEWQLFSALNDVAHLLGLEALGDDATENASTHSLTVAIQPPGIHHSRARLVAAILLAASSPMSTAEILDALRNLGHSVSGKNAANILAATLTRDKRFLSVVGPDRRRRWELAEAFFPIKDDFRVQN